MYTTGSTGEPSLPLAQARQVDLVCHQFEIAWKAGQRPRIEDYLGDIPEPPRAAVLRELIALEIAHRRRAGETPKIEDYQRFAEVSAEQLGELLALEDQAVRTSPDTARQPADSEEVKPAVRAKVRRISKFCKSSEELTPIALSSRHRAPRCRRKS